MRIHNWRARRLKTAEAQRPTKLFVSGGIGDVIALSCFLDVPESIESIHYATRNAEGVESYLSRICRRDVTHLCEWSDWSNRFCWFSLAEFVRTTGREDLSDAMDWSIASIFPRCDLVFRRFPWVSFSQENTRERYGLPACYAVLHPFTRDKRDPGRDLRFDEIRATLEAARSAGLPVVAINDGDEPPITGDGVIDLTNVTSIPEAIEITLNATAFVGVDSVLSVVATKVLDADRLCVKTINPHCRRFAHLYFAPFRSFEFLTNDVRPRLKELQWTA